MSIKFIGFHGTNETCAEKIERQGFKITSYTFLTADRQKIPGDLGAGAYFFHNSFENAYKFALKETSGEVKVLKCELEVSEEKFLNMDDPENLEILLKIRDEDKAMKSLKNRFQSGIGNKGRATLDGLIIEYLIFKYKLNVGLVKKQTYTPFIGMPRTSQYPNGTELCVREKHIIKNVKLEKANE